MSAREMNIKRRMTEVVRGRRPEPKIIHALRGIDLTIEPGERFGIVGPNGAGKSTLLSVIAGVLPPTRGSVTVDGRVLALLGSAQAGLDPEASGFDNIVTLGIQLGETPIAMLARAEEIINFSGLGDRVNDPAYTYSTGMAARLRFSTITSLRPDVLALDEGIGAADAGFSRRATERLNAFMSAAGTMVLASHDLDFMLRTCTRGIWLDQGVIQDSGPIATLIDDYVNHVSPQVAPDAPTA